MPTSNQADVDHAMSVSARAFQSWRRSTPSQGSLTLLKIATILESFGEVLVGVQAENCGKIISVTKSEELPPLIDHMRCFAGVARLLEGRGAAEYMEGMTNTARREPIEDWATVTPWNCPEMMAVWKSAPELVAGNTMVLKPSDSTLPRLRLSVGQYSHSNHRGDAPRWIQVVELWQRPFTLRLRRFRQNHARHGQHRGVATLAW
jgi:betaine-aldehyde dehydrogenase